jgi:hypothetical protein
MLKTGDVTADLDCQQLITTVAALELAADHALPAPRLIAADLDASAAGTVAVLMTVLPGSSKIPHVASAARLRALGAAAGALQRVALAPRPGLELRTRALYDVDFANWRKSAGTSRCWPGRKSGSPACQCRTANWCSCMGLMAGQYHLVRRLLQRHDRLGCRGRRITRHRSGHLALRRGAVFRIIDTGVIGGLIGTVAIDRGGRHTTPCIYGSWYRFTATFGRRRGGYLAIVLLIGMIGGIAMASVAAARRTQSSYPVFLASSNPSDLTMTVYRTSSGSRAPR